MKTAETFMEIEASAVFSIIYPMITYLQYEWHFLSQNCHGPGEKVLDEMQKAVILCSRILGVGSAILLGGKLIDMKQLTVVLAGVLILAIGGRIALWIVLK